LPLVRPPRILAALLVVLVTALAPATYAMPTDPTWLGGYWDNDDFDDVVLLLEGAVAVVVAFTVNATPPRDVVASVDLIDRCEIPVAIDDTATPRTPPLTASAV